MSPPLCCRRRLHRAAAELPPPLPRCRRGRRWRRCGARTRACPTPITQITSSTTAAGGGAAAGPGCAGAAAAPHAASAAAAAVVPAMRVQTLPCPALPCPALPPHPLPGCPLGRGAGGAACWWTAARVRPGCWCARRCGASASSPRPSWSGCGSLSGTGVVDGCVLNWGGGGGPEGAGGRGGFAGSAEPAPAAAPLPSPLLGSSLFSPLPHPKTPKIFISNQTSPSHLTHPRPRPCHHPADLPPRSCRRCRGLATGCQPGAPPTACC